jgi:peptidoglycan/xylan/chitin deacetylase (PgdA/CDA1 family)
VEPWPGSHAAAAVVAQDVEAGFANARYALDSLTAAHVRATFFVTSDLTRRNKQLTRMFAAAGEVGSHTENHRLLGGTSPGEQRERLGVSQRDLTALVGAPVRGLRPPEEQFDLATMAAWLDNGGTYLFGANDSRSAAPELLPVGRDTLLLLGRVTPDDFGARSDVRLGTDRLATAYLNDFAKMRSLGGLYVLSYHSQVLARPELVPVVARIARRLVADSATWVATAADIATWWRARAGLLVSAHTAGGERVSIDVRNRGSNPVSGAIVRVAMRSSAPARGAGVVVLPSDPGIVRIALPPIPGRATRRFQLSLAPPRRGRK